MMAHPSYRIINVNKYIDIRNYMYIFISTTTDKRRYISEQMNVKTTVIRQLQSTVDASAKGSIQALRLPAEGWIARVRKSLGMSGAQLGRRMGLSRSRISQAEKAETDSGVTLRTMRDAAEAMGCKFVYAIIPAKGGIREVIEAQARKKAAALVKQASIHMALEKQSLSGEKIAEEVKRITLELLNNRPSDFWEDE